MEEPLLSEGAVLGRNKRRVMGTSSVSRKLSPGAGLLQLLSTSMPQFPQENQEMQIFRQRKDPEGPAGANVSTVSWEPWQPWGGKQLACGAPASL